MYTMDNLTVQVDEIEALCSIYGSDWKTEDASHRSYSMKICEGSCKIIAYVKLPLDYPSQSPPEIELSAPEMNRAKKQEILLALNDVYLENNGEPVLYQWMEKIREFLQVLNQDKVDLNKLIEEVQLVKTVENGTIPVVQHGTTIQDRKSIFQGHSADVHSLIDVNDVMEYLLENKKIAEATHNISAYRIQMDKGNILQDFNDDGENQAGRRLLHLLQIVDVTNVMVVVSRWYGGIQLGPDRFRHINNAARQILEQAGYIVKKK